MSTTADLESAIASTRSDQWLYPVILMMALDLQAESAARAISAAELDNLDRALSSRASFMSAYHATQLRQKLKALRGPQSMPVNVSGLEGLVAMPLARNDAAPPDSSPTTTSCCLHDEPVEGVVRLAGREGESIVVSTSSSIVFLANLTACKVVLGPCSGAVFADHCDNCEIVTAAHQLRLTACHRLAIRCFVATSVNLEDCSDIAVEELAPAGDNSPYPEYQAQMATAGLAGLPNRFWHRVDFTDP